MLLDYDSDEEASHERLQPAIVRTPSPEPGDGRPGEGHHIPPHKDRGLDVLFSQPYLPSRDDDLASPSASTSSSCRPAMTDPDSADTATGAQDSLPEHGPPTASSSVDAKALEAQAAAALATEASTRSPNGSRGSAKRVDSAQDDELKQATVDKQPAQVGLATPLRLWTSGHSEPDETIAASPRLAKHTLPIDEGNSGTLPAFQPTSPSGNGAPNSPQGERLPPVRHLTDLVDAAAQHEARVPQYSHHHSQSFGSATAPSPMLPYHIPPNHQMSPSSQYAFSARSPTSAVGDHYTSPVQHHGSAYYMERRTSAFHDHPPIGLPASLPSASSSGESHGPAGSSTDGYSTSHTTPIDPAGILPDSNPRSMPILPPPRGMPPQNPAMMIGGFKCDQPGCEAAPFATQYLLSSHKNVHSSARPHYCPVDGCPRSEGGKGFKRKNEMIRHGLVHNSPGYICPFCPEREHKYPRPDNLQRHVRVHHAEKDRDDPLLREVLNQRNEGVGKARRKRANTGPS